MDNTTEQTYKKFIICDYANTLFDCRHRQFEQGFFSTNIKEDQINYAALTLLNDLKKAGYTIVYTHFLLNRLRPQIEKHFERYKLPKTHLYTNYPGQKVIDNISLKKWLYEEKLKDQDVVFVLDNDPAMRAYWLDKGVGLLQCQLPITQE